MSDFVNAPFLGTQGDGSLVLTETSKSGITSPFTRHKANMQIDRRKVFQSKKISDTREPSPCVYNVKLFNITLINNI